MRTQDHVAAHVNGLKSSLHAVEVQLTILKQLLGTEADASNDDDAREESFAKGKSQADDSDDDTDFGAKPAKGKKAAAASFDDGADDADATDTDAEESKPAKGKKAAAFGDEDEADEKPAKAKKAPKLTIDDVNDACKERCGRTNRAEVLGLLKKNFKVKSVTDLEPTDYEKCIKLLKGK